MNFYELCEQYLYDIAEKIEKLDIHSNIDVDYLDGILKITIINKKTFIINRNSGNAKIWYSSPFTGADYFSFDDSQKKCLNSSGIELLKKLLEELKPYLTTT